MTLLLTLCMTAFAQDQPTVVIEVSQPTVEVAHEQPASALRVVVVPGVGWNAGSGRAVHGVSGGLWASESSALAGRTTS